ncbi:hypothetical protein HY604_01310 [Candidatus Peregrinibacteria bacterium]|nr:hypothetical protein [Candidatus Peregrinibacteria bacterium]
MPNPELNEQAIKDDVKDFHSMLKEEGFDYQEGKSLTEEMEINENMRSTLAAHAQALIERIDRYFVTHGSLEPEMRNLQVELQRILYDILSQNGKREDLYKSIAGVSKKERTKETAERVKVLKSFITSLRKYLPKGWWLSNDLNPIICPPKEFVKQRPHTSRNMYFYAKKIDGKYKVFLELEDYVEPDEGDYEHAIVLMPDDPKAAMEKIKNL